MKKKLYLSSWINFGKYRRRAKYSEKDSRYGRGPQMVPVADG